jgi:hypothetical protein
MPRTILTVFTISVFVFSCTPSRPPVITGNWRLDSAVMVVGEQRFQDHAQASSLWKFGADSSLRIIYAAGNHTDSASYHFDTVDKKPYISFQNLPSVYPNMDIVRFTDKELELNADMTKRSFKLYFTRLSPNR